MHVIVVEIDRHALSQLPPLSIIILPILLLLPQTAIIQHATYTILFGTPQRLHHHHTRSLLFSSLIIVEPVADVLAHYLMMMIVVIVVILPRDVLG